MAETGARRYHGFVSYSHRGDLELAPALQKALQQLARPWSKRRALDVFRDQTGLSVNPALWTSITKALDDSEWFVLLASPESAASVWVGQEITHWVETRGVANLLPIVTDGEWVWDPAAGDLDWSLSTAAHPALRGVFSEAPRHIDLTWARKETDLSLRNARFRDAIAEIAAPMHGVSKPELETEHTRQQRRSRRVVRVAVAALAALTAVALASGALAIVNARTAAKERDRALTQVRLATAGTLTNRASTVVGSDRALSILLALESYRLEPSSVAETNIRTLLDTDVTGLIHGPVDGVADLAIDADQQQVAAVDGAGSVHVWRLDERERTLSTEPTRYATVDWLTASQLVVGDLDGRILLLDSTTGESTTLAEGATVVTDITTGLTRPVVAANEASGLIAIGKSDGTISIVDGTGEQEVTVAGDPPAVGNLVVGLVVTSDKRLIAHYGGIQFAVWQLEDGQATRLTEERPLFQDYTISDGRVVGNLVGGLAIDSSESRVATGVAQIDAHSGAALSHEGCGPTITAVIASSTTYAGGSVEPVLGMTGGQGIMRNPEEVPAEFAGDPSTRELCLRDGQGATALPITGSVWSIAGRDDGLILAGGPAGPVMMVRFGAASQRDNLPVADMLGLACYIAGRNLSSAEWEAYIPTVEPEQICGQWAAIDASTTAPPSEWTVGG